MAIQLVTGGAGFIGSHIVRALINQGHGVRVVDNLSTGTLQNIRDLQDRVEFIEADIQDEVKIGPAVEDVDCVFHEAALASVPLSLERPLETNAACVTGTLTLLDQARRAGVRRVIYAASSSLYGDQPGDFKTEADLPAPLSPYGVAKLSGEYYCHAFYQSYGLETVCLRYFNVFGPGQDPDSPYSAVIPLFLTAMLSGSQPRVFGDGLQSRDFTFVDNIVHGNLLAATAPDVGGMSFNIANGRSTSLLDLIGAINDLLDLSVEPAFEPPRSGDVRDSKADISRARKLLKYEPQVGFREGLSQSIDYYRDLVNRR